ncbi:MAG: hypothetical protein JWQ86_4253 [Mycobacterium sp.]|jgi:hypothetical protein|nr:hypothetical protein [Mycobacterium sp.]MDT5211884.1 hypothetical protein [Mycobacterium sp.]MDT5401275.1 hypothetical protein [Mycobacterium sp.]MDT7757409.1 hypothetical protein [Mycobacterium sp.]
MPPQSSQAETDWSPVSLLHSIHATRYSLHGGTARPPGAPSLSTRPSERPAHPSDVAQSRLFQAILLDELDELEDLVAAAERRWKRQREEGTDAPIVVPHAVLRLRERVKEARRLLDAINKRFPPD